MAKRNVSIPEETFHSVSKMCQLVTKHVNLWQNTSTCDKIRQLVTKVSNMLGGREPLRIPEYGHVLASHVT